MILNTKVILRYPGGTEADYQKKTLPILLQLSKKSFVLPGHGEPYFLSDVEYSDGVFQRYDGGRN